MKGKERKTVRKTDSEQRRRRENTCGTPNSDRYTDKGGRKGGKGESRDCSLVPFPLSPLIITHPSSKPASHLSSPCLCLRLSLFNNSPPAPCSIRLKAEVVSIAALPTWFGLSAWATVPGCKLMGSFGKAGHKEVSNCYSYSCLLKKKMTTHEA